MSDVFLICYPYQLKTCTWRINCLNLSCLLSEGGGCGVGLGLGWGFGAAFGTKYVDSKPAFEGFDFQKLAALAGKGRPPENVKRLKDTEEEVD
jgi:hypothetical protein